MSVRAKNYEFITKISLYLCLLKMKTTKVFFIFYFQTHFFWIQKVKTRYKFVTKPIFCGVSQFIVSNP